MLSELYTGGVLDAAAAIPAAQRLDDPQATATKVSRVCGSEVTVDLSLKDGVVIAFGMEAKACALGQASASILANNIMGSVPDELYSLRDQMRMMLKEAGPAPSGKRWEKLAMLEVIRDYPQRHASTMLVFEAVCACLDQITDVHTPN